MKYLKTYESDFSADHIEIGEFVLCEDTSYDIAQFTKNNIGQYIYDIYTHTNESYLIKYDYVPLELLEFFRFYEKRLSQFTYKRPMSRQEIIYHSKNKEDLEVILNSTKYNI